MNMKTKTIVKFICLLLALSLVTFLVILKFNKEEKKESIKAGEVKKARKVVLPEPPITPKAVQEMVLPEPPITPKAVQEEPLPQKKPFVVETEEAEMYVLKTIQGRVTSIEDVCHDTLVYVDGYNIPTGYVDLTGIQIGDFVEVTYRKNKKYGDEVLESIIVLP